VAPAAFRDQRRPVSGDLRRRVQLRDRRQRRERPQDHPAALDAAAANGLGFLLTDGSPQAAGTLQGIIGNANAGSAAGATDTRSASTAGNETPGIMQFLLARDEPRWPALRTAGLSIYDEPHKKVFGLVGHVREVMRELAPAGLPSVNVWPSYASANALGTGTYEACLEQYFEVVAPPVLCFDHYPLLSEGRITADYFCHRTVRSPHVRTKGKRPFLTPEGPAG